MTLIVILNVALITFVVVGLLTLLGWGIVTDKMMARSMATHGMAQSRTARERRRIYGQAAHPPPRRPGRPLDVGT